MFGRFSTPVFKNTGSVARDHLASERTFLAWLRTGLGFIALGIAIERFSQLDLTDLLPAARKTRRENLHRQEPDTLVAVLLGTGSGSIAYGTTRYFSNLKLLENGLYKPAYHGAALLSIAVAGIAGGVYRNALKERKDRDDED